MGAPSGAVWYDFADPEGLIVASTSQKKTTTKTTTKKSGSASGSRTAARKKPQPRPVRREVGGAVCWVLALCVFVSYFGISAIFIDWLAILLKGLFGYGYWLAGPALVLAGCILLFHHGRPVTLRVTCALLLPVLLGSLCHMLLVKEAYASSIGIIPALWKDGTALHCGGVISGALAQGSVAVFSKIASVIIFTVLFVLLAMAALRLTVGALIEKHRERPQYEYEEEPERPARAAKHTRETVAAIPAEHTRAQIDIPVDDPVSAPAKPAKADKPGFTSFFRHRSDSQKTPAQVVAQSAAPEPDDAAYEEGDPFAVKKPAAGACPGDPHHGAGGDFHAAGAVPGAGPDGGTSPPGGPGTEYGPSGPGAGFQEGGGPGGGGGNCRSDSGDRGEYGGGGGGIPLSAGEPAA